MKTNNSLLTQKEINRLWVVINSTLTSPVSVRTLWHTFQIQTQSARSRLCTVAKWSQFTASGKRSEQHVSSWPVALCCWTRATESRPPAPCPPPHPPVLRMRAVPFVLAMKPGHHAFTHEEKQREHLLNTTHYPSLFIEPLCTSGCFVSAEF